MDLCRLGFLVDVASDASAAASFDAHVDALTRLKAHCGSALRVRSSADVFGACGQAEQDGFRLLQHVLSDQLATGLFERLRDELEWEAMFHAAKAVSRRVSTLADIDAAGTTPIYRFPTDEEFHPIPFTATVRQIRDELEQLLAQRPLNHAKAQIYDDRTGYIGLHSDKTLDIQRRSTIVNLSLGATRTMRLERKSDKWVERVEMQHNSAVLFDTERANSLWRHGVPADKRHANEMRDDELIFDGQRISIVFRTIATFRTANQQLFGQGARNKDDNAHTEPADDAQALLDAFRAENNQGEEWCWEQTYGRGFDATDFSQLNRNRN